jgi:DNA-binding transcriptional MocR family regulator
MVALTLFLQLKPDRPWGKYYRHIIYAVPTFSNPSGKTMSLRRREAVVRLARQYDALIVTDDVYDLLQWPADPGVPIDVQNGIQTAAFPRLVDVDRYLDGGSERAGADGFGNTVSNASFSKILGPGVRTGWIEGTAKLAWGISQAYVYTLPNLSAVEAEQMLHVASGGTSDTCQPD